MSKLRFLLVPLLLLGVTLGLWMANPTQTAYAQTPSAGCTAINGGAINLAAGGASAPVGPMAAGETVTVTFLGGPGGTVADIVINGGSGTGGIGFVGSQAFVVAAGDMIGLFASGGSNGASATCTPASAASGPIFGAGLDPNGDADGDGVINSKDNCPTNANRDQNDSFGGVNGDACDNEFFDNGNGVKIFQQKDGSFAVFACSAAGCREIARVIPGQLSPTGGTFTFQGPDAQGWSVEVNFEAFGSEIYRMTVLAPGGGVAESRFQIIINNDNTVSWRVAGGGVATGRASGSTSATVDRNVSSGGAGVPAGSVVTTSALRVHLEPDASSIELVQQIPFGSLVTVVRTNESGDWAFVRSNGVEGWVLNGFFREFIPGVDDAIAEPFTANKSVRPGSDAQANGFINVRSEPSESATLLAQLPQGLVVRIIAEDPTGYWFRIQATGVDGWASNIGFSPVGTVGRLTPSSATPVKVGDNVITIGDSNGRNAASAGAEVIFRIPGGTEGKVTAIQNGFANVSFNGGSAWVSTSALAAFNALTPSVVSNQPAVQTQSQPAAQTQAQQPAVQTQPQSQPAAQATAATPAPAAVEAQPTAFTANGVVRPGDCAASIGTVNIRQEPSLSAPLLGQIAWGVRADILAEDPTGFWFKIRAVATVTDADGNKTQQSVEGWAANEWFGRPGDFITRGGGTVPFVCG